MLNDITVLMTGAGAPGAPGIIKCLRNNGERNIRIIGVDMNKNASGRKLVDAFYQVPAAKSPDFYGCIVDICKKENVKIIIPIVTKELATFAEHIESFNKDGIKVAVTSAESLKTANDKGALLNVMKANGLSVPDYRIANNLAEVKAAISELGYPGNALAIKPVFGNGSRGTRFLNNQISKYDLFFNEKPSSYFISYEELVSVLSEKPEIPQMMVMEFLPGTEYSVDVLAENGKVLYCICRKGMNVVSSIMVDVVIVEDEYIKSLCSKVVNILKLDGNIGFDLKENSQGKPFVMEINPRLTAGVVAGAAAGVNLPYLRIKQLLGEELPEIKENLGFIMQRRYHEIFFDSSGNEIEW